MNSMLFGFNVKDTQVGLKVFRGRVAKEIFKRIKINGYAFDVELLAVANMLGYERIIEVPVVVKLKKDDGITSANFWIVVVQMLRDTSIVFYNLKFRNRYAKIQK